MIQITEGMTPVAFLEAINYSFLPATTPLTAIMQADDFKTNYDANYDANKVTFTNLADKSVITPGTRASSFISALNSNTTKINTQFNSAYPYSKESYVVPNNRMTAIMGVWNYTLPSVLKLANSKVLISGLSRGGAMSRECFTVKRNIDGTYTNPALLGHDESTEGTNDTHGRAVFVEKAGVIYGIHEVLVGESATWDGGHNSPMICVKSIDGGDTWTEVSRVGDYLCYPQLMLIGGNFYLSARHQHGAESVISIFKSTDDCANWTELTKPYVSTSATYWAYHRIPENYGSEINIVVTEWKTGAGCWRSICHIRSTDGITYYNSAKTWSKNVDSLGSITRTELLANCLIAGNIDDATQFTYLGGFIKDTELYCLIGSGALSNPSETAFTGLKIYKGATVLIDLSTLLNGVTLVSSQTSAMLSRDNNIFSIFMIDYLDGYKIKKHRVGLGGIISTEVLADGVVDIYGQKVAGITMNTDRLDGRTVIVTKLTGDVMNDNSFADLIVFNNI